MTEQPTNLQSLKAKLRNRAQVLGIAERRLQKTVANTVVGQMLPDGVVKGGVSIRLRLPEREVRFTTDLDFARTPGLEIEDFQDELETNLDKGWSGFTGRLIQKSQATPEGVPSGYVMQPYEVRLEYLNESFAKVVLEVGHPEVGSSDDADAYLSDDIKETFTALGFPEPTPIKVMRAEHQAAQKLHACTGPGAAQRAHDLVDLQLLDRARSLDPTEIGKIGKRLFAYRKQHTWPPIVTFHAEWTDLYAEATAELDIDLLPLDKAIAWANQLISDTDPDRKTLQ